MNSWQELILEQFTPKVSRLTIVADPDGLLQEESVQAGIRDRGFELCLLEDHIAFRYIYESVFRSQWDKGEESELVVVVHSRFSDFQQLPFDIFASSRHLSFGLVELFPNLNYPVIASLEIENLDAVYKAQQEYAPKTLGRNGTIEFLLRHVFQIAPELISTSSDLLRMLLRRHYKGNRIPALLDKRLIQLLQKQEIFSDWPLKLIVPDSIAFFTFLQERWPVFLENWVKQQSGSGLADEESYDFEFPGPSYLPFDHDDVKVYIDNLFIEGFLHPVTHSQIESLPDSWIAIGVKSSDQEDSSRRIEKLLSSLEITIPDEKSRHDGWFRFAKVWAELTALSLEPGISLSELIMSRIKQLQSKIDQTFLGWLNKRYAGLGSLPPVPPVMLHHIPKFLSRHIGEDKKAKVAFVLVDGLSLNQWLAVRKQLTRKCPGYGFRESAVFAWVPTLTSVSRQAAFSGKPPVFFPDSILNTSKEPALWKQFWNDQGLTKQEVKYTKGLGQGSLEKVIDLVTHPKTRVVGLVVNTVDDIMHGMMLGAAGMHNQVSQWAGEAFLPNLIDLLFEHGFSVFLSSDHGNVEAKGCGRLSEGALADIRGERARVYSDQLARTKFHNQYPDSIEWAQIGLPEDFLPLLAPNRKAFVREGELIVSHGGASIEELIVPFVQIEKKS
ncbi:MAG: BREX-3 system phosphatase PglZ [Candidatus Sabulitectum sp.]|nr:BREX-3 system phosphatase PglZ [Candidatus Sabulitectum sp.]